MANRGGAAMAVVVYVAGGEEDRRDVGRLGTFWRKGNFAPREIKVRLGEGSVRVVPHGGGRDGIHRENISVHQVAYFVPYR